MPVLIVLILIVAFVFIGPIFTIWALNAVFGLSIEVTIWTWLSVAWLHLVISAGKSSK